MEKEKLRPIPSDQDYYITRGKRVWSGKSGRWLKVRIDEAGYEVVSLQRGGQSRVVRIHRLMLETFVGPCLRGMECRHLDGNRSNNDLDNLCWGTRQENASDRIRHGNNTYVSGPRKLFNKQVAEIRHLSVSGVPVSKLATRFCVCQQTIYDIVSCRHYSTERKEVI